MMQIVDAFAEFERTMLREGTRNGLDAGRKEGRVGGRRQARPNSLQEPGRFNPGNLGLGYLSIPLMRFEQCIRKQTEQSSQRQSSRSIPCIRAQGPGRKHIDPFLLPEFRREFEPGITP